MMKAIDFIKTINNLFELEINVFKIGLGFVGYYDTETSRHLHSEHIINEDNIKEETISTVHIYEDQSIDIFLN